MLPKKGCILVRIRLGFLGKLNNFYAYVANPSKQIDTIGLAEWIHPSLINFSQAYVTGETEHYEKAMKDGTWNWHKYSDHHSTPSALRVIEVNGELVSLDNRRLLAAQNAGLDSIPIQMPIYIQK